MNVSEPRYTIVLPNHEVENLSINCFKCGEKMNKVTTSETYRYAGENVCISNIQAYRCPIHEECEVYSSDEAKLIEEVLGTAFNKKSDGFDRKTALNIFHDLSNTMRPQHNILGEKILVIYRDKFEEIRKKYLDREE